MLTVLEPAVSGPKRGTGWQSLEQILLLQFLESLVMVLLATFFKNLGDEKHKEILGVIYKYIYCESFLACWNLCLSF